MLGLDVMMDHAMKPHLLEINASPSFTVGSRTDVLIKRPALAVRSVCVRERERVCVCASVREGVCMCVRDTVCVCMCERESVCV